jgi:hypothetical protein
MHDEDVIGGRRGRCVGAIARSCAGPRDADAWLVALA